MENSTGSNNTRPHRINIQQNVKPKLGISANVGRTFFLSPKVCASCLQPLGLFLSRGSSCPKCGQKVCKKCKVYRESVWTCLLCSKDLPMYGSKSMSMGGKSKRSREASYSNIKRSWSISATNRGSPVLKAYTKYNSDERQYSSLPRMPSTSEIQPKVNFQDHQTNYGGGQHHFIYSHDRNKRAKTATTIHVDRIDLDGPFQSTLHPYMTNQGQRSPTSSVNFIEDEYWDYYDYEINNSSNRSSCERSLSETTVEYKYFYEMYPPLVDPILVPPMKPDRRKNRSRSVGAYDTKYSQLKTYCVINNTNQPNSDLDIEIDPSSTTTTSSSTSAIYSNFPSFRKKRSNSLGKENISSHSQEHRQQIRISEQDQHNEGHQERIKIENSNSLPYEYSQRNTSELFDSAKRIKTIDSNEQFTTWYNLPPTMMTPNPETFKDNKSSRPIRGPDLDELFTSQSLPRKSTKNTTTTIQDLSSEDKQYSWPPIYNTSNTLPKEWKIIKRRDNGSTTIVISGINSPPNPSDTPVSLSMMTKNSTPNQNQPKSFVNNFSRTYISDNSSSSRASKHIIANHEAIEPPRLYNSLPNRKFPIIREPYPFFPTKIQPFHQGHQQKERELKPLLPLYHGQDNRHGIFQLKPNSTTNHIISLSSSPTPLPKVIDPNESKIDTNWKKTTTDQQNFLLFSSLSTSIGDRNYHGASKEKRNISNSNNTVSTPGTTATAERDSTSIVREVIINIQRENNEKPCEHNNGQITTNSIKTCTSRTNNTKEISREFMTKTTTTATTTTTGDNNDTSLSLSSSLGVLRTSSPKILIDNYKGISKELKLVEGPKSLLLPFKMSENELDKELTFCDLISSDESESSLSDSCFQSSINLYEMKPNSEELKSNNGFLSNSSGMTKTFRGEDKDELFLSCSSSTTTEDDNYYYYKDDDDDDDGIVGPIVVHNEEPQQTIIPHAITTTKNVSVSESIQPKTPEILPKPIVLQYEEMLLGLSDQEGRRLATSSTILTPTTATTTTTISSNNNSNSSDEDDEMVSQGIRAIGPDRDDEDMSTTTRNIQSSNTQRKYKSRVLIGLDEDQRVEVRGSSECEVEIVIGKGTFLHNNNDFESSSNLNHLLDNTSEGDLSKMVVHNTKLIIQSQLVQSHDGKGSVGDIEFRKIDTENEEDMSIEKNSVSNGVSGGITLGEGKKMQLVNTYRRESPEGEESFTEETTKPIIIMNEKGTNGNRAVPAPSRSSPDGADAENSEDSSTTTTTPILELDGSDDDDDCKSESTDSWNEESVSIPTDEQEQRPAPLDMTLHTICEESETESEHFRITPTNLSTNENEGLEKYYNFTTTNTTTTTTTTTTGSDREGIQNEQRFNLSPNYEESEFSDTFSESSFSSELQRNSTDFSHLDLLEDESDPVNLASGRLEKYFFNLGVTLSNDSDSVGSESESGSSVLENKKKVLKHHRRSAEYDDEQYEVSEDDDCAFEQDGFDTIKKQRKFRKSQEDLLSHNSGQNLKTGKQEPEELSQCHNEISKIDENFVDLEEPSLMNLVVASASSTQPLPLVHVEVEQPSQPDSPLKLKKMTSVSRSNSFNWSSDEEVNLMMRSLRQLIKNLTLSKKRDEGKGEKLVYLENELIRLMKNEQNMKSIVEHMSSDSEDQEDVYTFFEKADNQPELLSKVMTHIGERLSTWMRDEAEAEVEDTATIKCAQSVSSDLNEDLESESRFSWKGSFESTLAKRQSVGSSDSLDCGPSLNDGAELFSDRSILRSSSLHHLANSQPILEECESLTSSLTRLHQPAATATNSRAGGTTSITKSKSLFLDSQQEVKSARYRPPGYFETLTPTDTHASTPALAHRERKDRLDEFGKDSSNGFTIRGLIEFSMQYNYKNANFEVYIKQCRDLAAVDAKKGRSDPYVKGYLLPDRTKFNKKKTKTKKNTLNPVFGETLKFQITLEELESRTLWLSVWHSDMFGKNEFLGQVKLPLRGLTFDDTNFTWYPLKEEKFVTDDLEIEKPLPLDLILALKWISKSSNKDRGSLSVLVKEAKGLKLIKNSLPSTFIRCSPLNDRTKKQKTSLARRTTNPVWNTTMNFDTVSSEGLEVCLFNSDLLNHEQIGYIKLNCDSELWRNMIKRDGFWVEGILPLTTN